MAEKVLKFLCVGTHIHGIKFGPYQILILSDYDNNIKRVDGEINLHLSSGWMLYSSIPGKFPNSEEEIPKQTLDEELLTLCSLRHRKIVDILILDDRPHLVLTLDSGEVLFVNGHHTTYETWEVSVAYATVNPYQVVVAPGGYINVFTP